MKTTNISLLGDTVPIAVDDSGDGNGQDGNNGRTYLLLHGGAGPASMTGLAEALAATGRTIVPTHPGFEGQPRPQWFRRVDELALAYLALIERLDLRNVVLIGNSMGGWIAAEMGLRASPRVSAIVLLNAVGITPTPANGGIANPLTLAPAERAAYAFHDPAKFASALLGPGGVAAIAANQQTLLVYSGEPLMHDPGLQDRLKELHTPTLVLWGESDRIVSPVYGKEFADSIAAAQFELVPQAGHFPQIERLDWVMERVKGF